MSIYSVAIKVIAYTSRKLTRIVVVGANDGKINDPLYECAQQIRNRSHILLIEPNKFLNKVLSKNYGFHPKYKVCNKAVGPIGILKLYAVKPKYFEKYRGQDSEWPAYREATGITSAVREHVSENLTKRNIDPAEAIEVLTVEASELPKILFENDFERHIDVLQIDAEGFDDVVVYCSKIELTRPKIILYEHDGLSEEKSIKLNSFIGQHRYAIIPLLGSTLCVKRSFRMQSIAVLIIIQFWKIRRFTLRKRG